MTALLLRALTVLRQYVNTPESRELCADIESWLACGRDRYKPTEEEEERMRQ